MVNLTLDEIEELVFYNLSYGVSIKKTLEDIKRSELLEYMKFLL